MKARTAEKHRRWRWRGIQREKKGGWARDKEESETEWERGYKLRLIDTMWSSKTEPP